MAIQILDSNGRIQYQLTIDAQATWAVAIQIEQEAKQLYLTTPYVMKVKQTPKNEVDRL